MVINEHWAFMQTFLKLEECVLLFSIENLQFFTIFSIHFEQYRITLNKLICKRSKFNCIKQLTVTNENSLILNFDFVLLCHHDPWLLLTNFHYLTICFRFQLNGSLCSLLLLLRLQNGVWANCNCGYLPFSSLIYFLLIVFGKTLARFF